MPLDFLPKLQHLALDLGANPTPQGIMQTHESLFSAIGMLKGLRTLYVQSTRQVGNQQPSQVCKTIKIAKADLTACAHLQHVALRGVGLDGELIFRMVAVCMQLVSLLSGQKSRFRPPANDRAVWRGMSFYRSGSWPFEIEPGMHSLTRLQVDVYRKGFDGSEKYLIFRPNRIPGGA